MAVRIDILNQTQLGFWNGCRYRPRELQSEMPGALYGDMNPMAYGKFKQQVDHELNEVNKYGRLIWYGRKMCVALFFIAIAIYVGVTLYLVMPPSTTTTTTTPCPSGLTRSQRLARCYSDSETPVSRFNAVQSKFGVLWGVGLAILCLPNLLTLYFRCKLGNVVSKTLMSLKGACAQASSENPGLSFDVRSEFVSLSRRTQIETLFIEVFIGAGAPVVTPGVIQGAVVLGQMATPETNACYCAKCGREASGNFCAACGASLL